VWVTVPAEQEKVVLFGELAAPRVASNPTVEEHHSSISFNLLVFATVGVRRHLVAQPALEQHTFSCSAGTVTHTWFSRRARALRGGEAMYRSSRGSSNWSPEQPRGVRT